MFPNILNLIYDNNHVYEIKNNNEFGQNIDSYQKKIDDDLIVSNNYNLNIGRDKVFVLMKTKKFEEILNHVYNTKDENYVFISNDDELNTLLYDMKYKYKHEPTINTDRCVIKNIITQLFIDDRKINITIKMPLDDIDNIVERDDEIKTQKYYEIFYKEQQKLYLEYINNENLSHYNEKTEQWLKMYYPNIPIGECFEIKKKNILDWIDLKHILICLLD